MNESESSKSTARRAKAEQFARFLIEGAGTEMVDQKDIPLVHDHLQQYIVKYIKAGDYLQAQVIEDICNRLLQQKTEKNYFNMRDNRFDRINGRIRLARKDLEEARRNVEEQRAKFELEKDQALEILDSEQDRELDDFDRENCREMPQSFKKFSREYLQLRKQEEYLVQSKRYMEADAVKEEADVMERKEIRKQEENWVRSVSQQRDIVIQKMARQRTVLIEKFNTKWSEIYPSAEREVERAEKALKAAEAKLTEAADMVKGSRARPPIRTGIVPTNRSVSMRTMDYTSRMKRTARHSISVK